MTSFDYKLESIRTERLELDYFLVPWDTEIIGTPVAEIRGLRITDAAAASNDYETFSQWISDNNVGLCSCRIPHSRLEESMFLESQDFRFIELNFRPYCKRLHEMKLSDDEIKVEQAQLGDRDILANMAGTIFHYGRFHQDPRLGAELGNYRYRKWLMNAFELPHQVIYKCILDNDIVAFFVVESPDSGEAFWSLVGLAPGKEGRGLGKRVWRSMLAWHQREGINTITTSISSHNIAVLNLYVSLGFRFPAPSATFHWRSPDMPAQA